MAMQSKSSLASRLTGLVISMGVLPPAVVLVTAHGGPNFELTLGALGFCSLVSVAAGLWLIQSIARPLALMTGPAARLAKGDTAHSLEHRSTDELGALADALRELIDYLQHA